MAQAVVTFTDLDLDAGTVSADIRITDSPSDDGLVTMAHVWAKFVMFGTNDPAFLTQVYEFADRLMNQAPTIDESEVTEAACAA